MNTYVPPRSDVTGNPQLAAQLCHEAMGNLHNDVTQSPDRHHIHCHCEKYRIHTTLTSLDVKVDFWGTQNCYTGHKFPNLFLLR